MDNFYIKIHIGAEKPFYKNRPIDFYSSQSWSKILGKNGKESYEYNEFDENFLQKIRFRQLIHSQALCEYLPMKVDLELDSETLKCRLSEFKEQYKGTFDSETDWRLAIGLGQASVFETSITLHHIYGIPYIPASAVKGILRSWIIIKYFSNNGKDLKDAECNAYQNLSFCRIFGAPAKPQECKESAIREYYKNNFDKDIDAYMGDIVFFDAFPTKVPTVSVDIMNPHYQPYYNDDDAKTPPADWFNPVPIFFLTIKNTGFQFLFGIRKGRDNFKVEINGENKGNVIEFLSNELKEALTNHGIGAKTAVGYGRFKIE